MKRGHEKVKRRQVRFGSALPRISLDFIEPNPLSEWKYLIRGASLDGRRAVVVTKMSPTGKMLIITVFDDE